MLLVQMMNVTVVENEERWKNIGRENVGRRMMRTVNEPFTFTDIIFK